MAVTRFDLAGRVAEKTGVSRRAALRIINAFIEETAEAVREGERVELRNFGVFSRKESGGKVLRSPRTGKRMRVPARTSLKFKPSARFKEDIPGEGSIKEAGNGKSEKI